jgi:hypothetical protein
MAPFVVDGDEYKGRCCRRKKRAERRVPPGVCQSGFLGREAEEAFCGEKIGRADHHQVVYCRQRDCLPARVTIVCFQSCVR